MAISRLRYPETYARRTPVVVQLALFKEHQRTGPPQRPSSRFSAQYCGWLDKNWRQRPEVLARQRFKCWECGYVLVPRGAHLHHPNGYANLGQEEATDLVAVHSTCHRRIHERLIDGRQRALDQARWNTRSEACGCQAA